MKPREWGLFVTLGLIWGSSFLWIKIAVSEIGPFALVSWRLLFGLAGLALVVLVRRPEFPRDRRLLGALALLGITNQALPFAPISWGGGKIGSDGASLLR